MIHMSRGRRQPGVLAAIIIAAVLAAACTTSPAPAPTGNPQAGPVPQVAASDTGQPPPASPPVQAARSASQRARHTAAPASPAPAPTSQQAVPPVPACATAGLRGSLGAATGAAGTFYYPIQLTNATGTACTLFGYPGVSVVTSPSGSQVGDQAVRISTFGPQLVTIAPGATVHATMQMPNAGVLDASVCVPQTVHWLRVYPPGEFTSLYISVPVTANPVQICTGKHLGNIIPLGIFVVMPGSTGT
ncbi:MAG TPA: DUF4232 domain-containing protein [Streptosporangiaceae bacterium]|nr:DUF4232 domain-containing protein [Streptosporangiaceae bacterium]